VSEFAIVTMATNLFELHEPLRNMPFHLLLLCDRAAKV